MAQKPETVFIKSVHRHLPPDLYVCKNHNEYNGGIADCWYDGERDLWVEYKFIKVPVRDTTVIDLVNGKDPAISVLQQEWLKARHANGRSVGVIVGSEKGGVWFPGDSWNKTYTAAEFRNLLVPRAKLADIIYSLTRGRHG